MKTVLYLSCSELPFDRFLTALIEKNYTALIKKPGLFSISKEKLIEHWFEIYSEYCDLAESEASKAYLNMIKRKLFLETKVALCEALISSLMLGYNYETTQALKKLGFNFKLSKMSYMADLKKVIAKAKPMVLEIGKIKKELEPYLTEETPASKTDFLALLVILSKHQGYHLDAKKITVEEYILTLKAYDTWLQQQKSQK
jgi:hypothetical protein